MRACSVVPAGGKRLGRVSWLWYRVTVPSSFVPAVIGAGVQWQESDSLIEEVAGDMGLGWTSVSW